MGFLFLCQFRGGVLDIAFLGGRNDATGLSSAAQVLRERIVYVVIEVLFSFNIQFVFYMKTTFSTDILFIQTTS